MCPCSKNVQLQGHVRPVQGGVFMKLLDEGSA